MFLQRALRRLWTTAPRDLAHRLKRRASGQTGPDYTLAGILKTRHLNFNLILDKWERYWRVIDQQQKPHTPARIDFKGRVVMELGCGPLLGLGPLALYLGATDFYYSEPALLHSLVEAPEIKERYFQPLYEDFVVNLGRIPLTFEAFYQHLLLRSAPLEQQQGREGFVDVVFSNSVLEHIPRAEIDGVLCRLHDVSIPGGEFLHVVDFGAHRTASKGLTQLGTLYQEDWDAEKPGINYLRLSDMKEKILSAGFELEYLTIYRRDPLERARIHGSWSRYSDEDLTARVVFFGGRRPKG